MAIDENAAYPAHGVSQSIGDSLDKTRDRFAWLVSTLIANGVVLLPNWDGTPYSTSSPEDLSEPNYWLFTHNSDNREIRVNLTWASGNITQVVIKYNPGTTSPGMETVTGGTFTLTYDGDNNLTGFTSA